MYGEFCDKEIGKCKCLLGYYGEFCDKGIYIESFVFYLFWI